MIYPRFQKIPVSDRGNKYNKEIVNEIGFELSFWDMIIDFWLWLHQPD